MTGPVRGGGLGGERRLLVATHSTHKLEELRRLLDLPHATLVSLSDLGIRDDAPEEGETFEENASAKAAFYAQRSGLPTLADDSGIEVDALGGAPGVRTRRYAGPDATDARNNEKLLGELRDVPAARRTARYRCVLVFLEGGEAATVREGVFEGRIAGEARGRGGFGYDPVFEPLEEPVGGRTVGQMTPAEKDAVSHRASAARGMAEALRRRGW